MTLDPATKHVTFLPGGERAAVPEGTTLLEAARRAGVAIEADCDGEGICGKCRLIVQDGPVHSNISIHLDDEDLDHRVVLACQAQPTGDVTVLVTTPHQAGQAAAPAGQAAWSAPQAALDPLLRRVSLAVADTTMAEAASDAQRLEQSLADDCDLKPCRFDLDALRKLGPAIRRDEGRLTAALTWHDQAWQLFDVDAGHDAPGHVGTIAAAVDVGTSTIDAQLIDVTTGRAVDALSRANSQRQHGADYITRIMALDRTASLADLQSLVVSDIRELLEDMARRQGLRPSDIHAIVAAGNTPMTHFLLGLDPTMIRKAPYVPVTNVPAPVAAADIGLPAAPGARLYPLPGVAAFVGSDITAGVLATGMDRHEGVALLIDIGTNGEIVLGGRDWLACASSSAGAAFEGTRFGMRGVRGAIERVRAEADGTLHLTVIGNEKPRGLCGSGVLDLVAELFRIGVLRRDGRLDPGVDDRSIRQGEEEWQYVVATAEEAAHGRPIYLTQSEIANVIRSKAGVAAAVATLMALFEVQADDLDVIYLAGAFGSFVDVNHAIRIGLLPEVALDTVRYVGNTSLLGARQVLRSRPAYDRIHAVAGAMTYIDLMSHPAYMDEFVQANFLPHTDSSRHPLVLAELGLTET